MQASYIVRNRIGGFRAVALTAALAVLVVAGMLLKPSLACASVVEPGTYEVDLSALQASSDRVSMCDGALGKPAKLKVSKDGTALELTLNPLTTGGLSGYVGAVRGFPDWKGEGTPSSADAVEATVLSVYEDVTDDFNSSDSSDDVVRGSSYPETVSVPWDTGIEVGFIQVYIPIMNSISPGSGWQFVRLSLDYGSLTEVEDREDGSHGSSSSSSSSSSTLSSSSTSSSSSISSSSEASDSSSSSGSGGSASSSSSASDPGSSSTSASSVEPLSPSGSADGGQQSASSSASQEVRGFDELADGSYTVTVSMVKTDKTTLSMADKAFSHDAELNVEDGAYSIDASLSSIAVGDKTSYLGELSYFKSGYKTAKDGTPTGETEACEVLAYQMSNGEKVSDQYGSDYPASVRIPLISEAISSGYVPLQAFVPIMEVIAEGTGTQAMYMLLDRDSVTLKDPAQDDEDDQDSSSSSPGSKKSGSSSKDSGTKGAAAGKTKSAGSSSGSGGSSSKAQGMLGTNTLPSPASESGAGSANDMGGAIASHTQSDAPTSSLPSGAPAAAAASPAAVPSTAVPMTSQSSSKISVSQSSSFREVHPVSAGVDAGEKEPPLKGAVVPAGVATAVVVLSGAAFSAFRNRSWMVE